MKHDVILPEKDFFTIHFLPEREIFQMTFIETFLKEIQLYQQYGETPYPDHPSKDFLETYETNFRELISSLDADAFCSENTFWSTAAEEMGYGII